MEALAPVTVAIGAVAGSVRVSWLRLPAGGGWRRVWAWVLTGYAGRIGTGWAFDAETTAVAG